VCRVVLFAVAAAVAGIGCGDTASRAAADPAPDDGDDNETAAAGDPGAAWDHATAALAAQRTVLSKRYAKARGEDRDAVVAEASTAILASLDDVLAPWFGTPWGLGSNSTARRPHEPGMTVGCSYFVTSILDGLGVDLDNRYHFAQAAALHIQRSLLGGGRAAIHRYLSIPPADLAAQIAALGDGLYLIGLSNHVGFVRVVGGDVRFVHASYTGGQVVSDEPLATSEAIATSQPAGYFVSELVTAGGDVDDWLVRKWLEGDTVAFDPKR